MKSKITIVFILIVFSTSFYIQDRYAIFSIDDWTYAFVVNEDAFNYQTVADYNVERQPINSLYDAIVSQSIDYFKTNGRFIIHTLVQYFCGTWTMSQFVILNSIVFAIFTLLVIRLSINKLDIWNLLLMISAIWIFLPHKGLTFMGNITCSLDYLWSCTANLFFIVLLEQVINNKINKNFIPFYIFYALIVGSLQESFSIGILGAIIILLIWKRKTATKNLFFITIAYTIGTSICMLTPANFRRFDDIGGMGFHANSILGLLSSPPFLLLLFTIVYFVFKRKLKTIIQDNINIILILAVSISVVFALFIAYNGRHQLTAINVFSLIVLFRIFIPLISNKKLHFATIVILSLAILSYMPILSARKAYYDAYNLIIERSAHTQSGSVSGSEFEKLSDNIRHNRLIECNYIWPFTFQDWDFFEKSLSVYLTKGKDNQYIKEVSK